MKLATILTIFATLGLASLEASAQQRFYDSQGHFVGSTHTSGSTTYIRDAQGHNVGSIRR
jgi:YD repeat-containing protein